MKSLVFLLVTFLSLASIGVHAAPLTYLFGGKVTSSTMGAFEFSEVQVQVGSPFIGSFTYDSLGSNPQPVNFEVAVLYEYITGLGQGWTVLVDKTQAQLGVSAPDVLGFDNVALVANAPVFGVFAGKLENNQLLLYESTYWPSILSDTTNTAANLLLQGPDGAMDSWPNLDAFTMHKLFGVHGLFEGNPWNFVGQIEYLQQTSSPVIVGVVPEPGTGLLIAFGLAGLWGVTACCRKQNKG